MAELAVCSEDSLLPATHVCSCVGVCPTKFNNNDVEGMRATNGSMTESVKREHIFNLVRCQVSDSDGNVTVPTKISWTLHGQAVCRKFWEHAHGASHRTVDKALRVLRAGGTEPMAPMPLMPNVSAGAEKRKADAWFLSVHQELGGALGCR